MGYIFRFLFVSDIGNKMNEKNISHIARNCHAITGATGTTGATGATGAIGATGLTGATDVLQQNFALHLASHIALLKYRKLHSVARIWDICTPY